MKQRKIINEVTEQSYDEESGSAKVVFDGKQFLVRIPTAVAEASGVKKGDTVNFKVKIVPEPQPIENSKIEMEYVRKNAK